MAKSAEQTRRRILETAYDLFYRRGFTRVGVDEIAARAGVTKRTLYYHFTSKDELLGAVLELYNELALTRIGRIADRLSPQREAFVESLFAQLAEWAGKPRWAGAGFTRLTMELADLPGHPARAVARRHKAAVETWIAGELARRKVIAPQDCARQMMLLIEGAMALILVHGDRRYAKAAAAAAKQLVTGARSRGTSWRTHG